MEVEFTPDPGHELPWMLNIRKAQNGFICAWQETLEDDTIRTNEQVFQEDDEEKGELICLVEMLWFITGHFGILPSKHNKHYLEIKIKSRNLEVVK